MPSSRIALIVATMDAAATGCPGVREPTGEHSIVEGRGDLVTDDDPAHGDVAGVHTFGERDQVGATPKCSYANQSPVRPKPAITSSAM